MERSARGTASQGAGAGGAMLMEAAIPLGRGPALAAVKRQSALLGAETQQFCWLSGPSSWDCPRRPDFLEGCRHPTPLHPHPSARVAGLRCCPHPQAGWTPGRHTSLFSCGAPISPGCCCTILQTRRLCVRSLSTVTGLVGSGSRTL